MRGLALCIGLSLLACGDEGDCPFPEPLDYFTSGDYTAPGGTPVDWYCESDCSATFIPHVGVAHLDMTLDLEAQLATISYTRDGVAVVERWNITERRSQ